MSFVYSLLNCSTPLDSITAFTASKWGVRISNIPLLLIQNS